MNNKIKILFTIGTFGVGGKERQLAEIIKNLPQEKYELYLLVKNIKSEYIDESEKKTFIKNIYDLNKPKFSIFNIFTFLKIVKESRPDIVFSFSTLTSHFFLLLKRVFFFKYKIINFSIQNAPDSLSIQGKLESFFYGFYSCVVGNSEAGLKTYGQSGKKRRFLLYNGISSNRIVKESRSNSRKNLGWSENLFYVVMVSSLRKDYSKDPITFVKTAEYISKKDAEIVFVLIGDGELMPEIKDYIEKNEVRNISLLGNRNNVESYFKAADLSVLTSKSEGISNSILESMAQGTPVIATSTGGTPEIIKHEYNGYVAEYKNYKQIGELIMKLKINKELKNVLGDNAIKTIGENFSTDSMIFTTENIIKSVYCNER